MKNPPLAFLIPLSMTASLCMATPSEKEAPATFTVLEQGINSGIVTERFHTIRDMAGLHAFWREHGRSVPPTKPFREVDFSKEMVIAAFSGQKSTGGYQLNATGINRRGGHIEVNLSLTKPGPDCLVADGLTHPYVLIKTKQTKKPVTFQFAQKTFSCVTGNPLTTVASTIQADSP